MCCDIQWLFKWLFNDHFEIIYCGSFLTCFTMSTCFSYFCAFFEFPLLRNVNTGLKQRRRSFLFLQRSLSGGGGALEPLHFKQSHAHIKWRWLYRCPVNIYILSPARYFFIIFFMNDYTITFFSYYILICDLFFMNDYILWLFLLHPILWAF